MSKMCNNYKQKQEKSWNRLIIVTITSRKIGAGVSYGPVLLCKNHNFYNKVCTINKQLMQ